MSELLWGPWSQMAVASDTAVTIAAHAWLPAWPGPLAGSSLWIAPPLFAQGGAAPSPGGGALGMLPVLFGIGMLFYLLILRPQRQEQAQREQMLGALKKNDRVVTVGGIYGLVTNIRHDADEVTIRVDENTNTKLRITRSSIARVITSEEASAAETKETSEAS